MRQSFLLVSLVLVALAACGGSRSELALGKRSGVAGDWDRAVAHYENALRENPENLEARISLQRARYEASLVHLSRARKHQAVSELEEAAAEIEIALALDPTHDYAREELLEIRRRLVEKSEGPRPLVVRERLFAPIDLHFPERTSLRDVLEALAKLAGVNILFDESYRDREVSVELKGASFEQALELLLTTNGLFYKVVSSETVRVVPGDARGPRHRQP